MQLLQVKTRKITIFAAGINKSPPPFTKSNLTTPRRYENRYRFAQASFTLVAAGMAKPCSGQNRK